MLSKEISRVFCLGALWNWALVSRWSPRPRQLSSGINNFRLLFEIITLYPARKKIAFIFPQTYNILFLWSTSLKLRMLFSELLKSIIPGVTKTWKSHYSTILIEFGSYNNNNNLLNILLSALQDQPVRERIIILDSELTLTPSSFLRIFMPFILIRLTVETQVACFDYSLRHSCIYVFIN